ncbi:MAG: type I glyceraldehyde-3-phosphate dehydrogenase [Ilumatobacteraceae bacterium]
MLALRPGDAMTRVAINGFGRIGRSVVRAALARPGRVEVVAVNDTNDPAMLVYLLEHDTVHGPADTEIALDGNAIHIGDDVIALSHDPDPSQLPWGDLGVDVVIESTGRFTMADEAAGHLKAGAGRVIISAPATGQDLTVCMGVNHDRYDPALHTVVSNASCTTNCLASMVDVLHRRFGFLDGFMSTVHAYTNDQNLLDLPHRGHTRDFRRSRAAAQNIVPSTTGAARAIDEVLPELAGRLDGMAFRVPVACGSVTDLVCTVGRPVSSDEVNAAFTEAATEPRFDGVLAVTDIPLVSSDIIGRPQSCVFSACDTMTSGDRVKVLGWYDNEWGYANRLLELSVLMGAVVTA